MSSGNIFYIWSCDIQQAEFEDKLKILPMNQDSYCWIKWQLSAYLGHLDHCPPNRNTSLSGRIFGRSGEIKWQVLSDGIRLVYTGETKPPFDSSEPLKRLTTLYDHDDLKMRLDHFHLVHESLFKKIGENQTLFIVEPEYSTELGDFSRLVDIKIDSPSPKALEVI